MLERYIAVQPKANKLSLPLDRKLGDITRYKYVLAHALPLRLERLTSDQPSANALKLGMMQPLGTIAPPLYFISSSLPLPLTVAVSEQPQPNVLPLNMSRRLGTAIAVPVMPPDIADDINLTVNAIAVLMPTASANVSVSDDNAVGVSVAAIADLMPVASAALLVESLDAAITITATATLNPVASAAVSYDSNNPSLVMLDVSSDMQNAKLQGIDKRSGFENNDILMQQVTADWQQSTLIGTDNQAQFEANEQLTSSSQVSFEQSKLIGDSNKQGGEYQTFIASKSKLQYEQAKLVGHDRWFGFDAMVKRQIERSLHGENAKLLTDKLSSYNEYSRLLNTCTDFLIETARLPFSKLRYVPPPLSQTVILKQQIIEGWECGSGALRHYVYNDELALPMTRCIADRGVSSSLVMPITMPRGILMLSAADANALPNYPCKRKTLAVNPTLDIVTCKPKVFGKSTGIAVNSQATLNTIAWLSLLIGEQGEAYNKGVIFVTNSVSLTRSDDGREIVLNSFNISSDNNSFGWSFNASLPFTELNKVNILNEEFVSVDLNVNGFLWRFILDACDDSVQFNNNNLNIKGQSRSMLLTSPYFDARSYKFQEALSSRQIAESELNRDSQLTGFSLDWNLIEANGWNVPANVYSYIDKTPINSLQHIANSVGGFVNTHPNQDVIKMLSHYPVASWDWETLQPKITLTESIITSMSRKRNRRPNYNGVVVSGEHSNSVSVFASRTGSDGGYRPSMITNNLITEQSAGIERAKVELSRSGDMAEIDLSSPLIKELGILYPSDFIRIIDSESWIGIVRGVSITGSIGSSRDIKIEQKLKIERNLNGA